MMLYELYRGAFAQNLSCWRLDRRRPFEDRLKRSASHSIPHFPRRHARLARESQSPDTTDYQLPAARRAERAKQTLPTSQGQAAGKGYQGRALSWFPGMRSPDGSRRLQ
jgi:hypothetical protein